MIDASLLIAVGTFGQPHGLKGELQAIFVRKVDPEAADCIIAMVEGLPVPFFVDAVRPKGVHSYLLTIDGVDSREKARMLCGHTIYLEPDSNALADDEDDDQDAGRFYLDDLMGFKAVAADGRTLGTIDDYDDTTENVLMIITRDDGTTVMIPAVDEFIVAVDPDGKTITLDPPDGLL